MEEVCEVNVVSSDKDRKSGSGEVLNLSLDSGQIQKLSWCLMMCAPSWDDSNLEHM